MFTLYVGASCTYDKILGAVYGWWEGRTGWSSNVPELGVRVNVPHAQVFDGDADMSAEFMRLLCQYHMYEPRRDAIKRRCVRIHKDTEETEGMRRNRLKLTGGCGCTVCL